MMWLPGVPCEFCVSSVKSADRDEEKMSTESSAVDEGSGCAMREVSMTGARGLENGRDDAGLGTGNG